MKTSNLKQTVVHLYYDNEIFTVDDIATTGAYNKSAETFKNIEKVGILCNRAVFDSSKYLYLLIF